MAAFRAACLLALIAAASAAYLQIETPVTTPFDTKLTTGTIDIPLNDPRVAPAVGGITPEQIQIGYVSATSVIVTWITGQAQVAPKVTPYDPNTVGSLVQYGPSGLTQNATGTQEVYTQIYNSSYSAGQGLNYTSGIIHHVTLTGLTPNTDYLYKVGDPITSIFSSTYNFTTLPAPGEADQYPLRIGVIADPGQTVNTSTTLDHLVANDPQVVFLIADFCYADNFNPNGVFSNDLTAAQNAGAGRGTFQVKWDTFGRLFQKLFAHVPLLTTNGNHEIERQADGRTQVSYKARYPTPYNQSYSTNPLYYSANVGPVHTIWLSSYIPYGPGSPQYMWLEADLASVDRAVTPWLVANWHAPWYNTYISHYKEVDCMRQALEPMLFEYGVDISFLGHVHAYERTNPVYNYTVNQCGIVHLTMGDGGNNEKLYTNFADQPGFCPQNNTPTAKGQPAYQPEFCPQGLFLEANGKFCPTQQPAWSAYREPSFGHGILDVLNSTHALWQWHRNQDGAPVVTDAAMIVRGSSTPAKGCATSTAPGASVAG